MELKIALFRPFLGRMSVFSLEFRPNAQKKGVEK